MRGTRGETKRAGVFAVALCAALALGAAGVAADCEPRRESDYDPDPEVQEDQQPPRLEN